MAWCHAGAVGSWDREAALIYQARLFTNHVTLDKSLHLLNTEMGIMGPAPKVMVLTVRAREIMLQGHCNPHYLTWTRVATTEPDAPIFLIN